MYSRSVLRSFDWVVVQRYRSASSPRHARCSIVMGSSRTGPFEYHVIMLVPSCASDQTAASPPVPGLHNSQINPVRTGFCRIFRSRHRIVALQQAAYRMRCAGSAIGAAVPVFRRHADFGIGRCS
jgi:hypothetical protein